MPAVGFGLGLERLLMTMADEGVVIQEPARFDVFIASMGDDAALKAASMAHELRTKGLKVDIDHMGKKLKAQMKYANKVGARYTMILGDDELANDKASLKEMQSGEQVEVKLAAEDILQLVNRGE